MIKATMLEVRDAYSAFVRIFDETKLDHKSIWRVSRILEKLQREVARFEMEQKKLYKDAGAIVDIRGITMDLLQPQQHRESLSDYAERRRIYLEKVNALSEQLEALNNQEVQIDYEPIPLSIFPKERKNDKGEMEPITYRATDFSNTGPFVCDG